MSINAAGGSWNGRCRSQGNANGAPWWDLSTLFWIHAGGGLRRYFNRVKRSLQHIALKPTPEHYDRSPQYQRAAGEAVYCQQSYVMIPDSYLIAEAQMAIVLPDHFMRNLKWRCCSTDYGFEAHALISRGRASKMLVLLTSKANDRIQRSIYEST